MCFGLHTEDTIGIRNRQAISDFQATKNTRTRYEDNRIRRGIKTSKHFELKGVCNVDGGGTSKQLYDMGYCSDMEIDEEQESVPTIYVEPWVEVSA